MADRVDECSWEQARTIAYDNARGIEPVTVALEETVGSVLASPLVAFEDIPAADVAATDGWAVVGNGPWTLKKPGRVDLLSGAQYHEAGSALVVREGQAAPVHDGESLGDAVTAVLATARGKVNEEVLTATHFAAAKTGTGIRARGSDAGRGTELLPAGERVTPAVAALAATAGHDVLEVVPMPTVTPIRIGNRVVDSGQSREGRLRDAVAPALAGWIANLNARCLPSLWVTEGDAALLEAIDDVISDIVLTTGPASEGAVRRLLDGMGVTPLIDEVAVRPGGSMILAMLPNGRPWVHISAGPTETVVALVTVLAPLIDGMTGQRPPRLRARCDEAIAGDRRCTTLLPVRRSGDRRTAVAPIRPSGPEGLFALSTADNFAVVPPGGVLANEPIEVVQLP